MIYTLTILLVISIIFNFILYFREDYSNENQSLKKYKDFALEEEQRLIKRRGSLQQKWDYGGGSDKISVEACIMITELERFKNGKCRVRFDGVAVSGDMNLQQESSIKTMIKTRFNELQEIKNIDWLEIDEGIKKERLNKLKKLNLE